MSTTQTAASDPSARWERVFVPNYATPRLELVEGHGTRVKASNGKEYLDLIAGIAVSSVGHAHPMVVRAVQEQVGRLVHTSNLFANGPGLQLAERLHRFSGGKRVYLCNSGTEANEANLKATRRWAHEQGMPDAVVVAFEKSFHGRTMGSLSLTGQPHHRERFDPLVPQIRFTPFNDPAALERVFEEHQVAGVFAEAVQGEGGVMPMTQEFADTLGKLTRDNNALLAMDEVQTGVGRTGRFFAAEHFGLKPDLVSLAKGLGGGMPVGAALMADKVARLLGVGAHGTTYGGNPVACAAANAVLDVYEKERLDERANRLGKAFTEELDRAVDALDLHTRGLGLLQGLPLGKDVAPAIVNAMQERGVLIGQAGKGVLRVAPPLVIDHAELLGVVPGLADEVRQAVSGPA